MIWLGMCLSNAKHYSTVSTKAVSLTAAPSDRRKSSSSAVLTLGEPTRFVHWPGFAPPPSRAKAARGVLAGPHATPRIETRRAGGGVRESVNET